jgi:hypothetical protein
MFLDVRQRERDAWKEISKTARPLFQSVLGDVYAYPPLLNSRDFGRAAIIFGISVVPGKCVSGMLLVTGNVNSSSGKLNGTMAPGKSVTAAFANEVCQTAAMCTLNILQRTMSRGASSMICYENNGKPAVIFEFPHADGRVTQVNVQLHIALVSEGKAKRSVFEQGILEMVSDMRKELDADKKIPYAADGTLHEGALFPVGECEIATKHDPMCAKDLRSVDDLARLAAAAPGAYAMQPKLDGRRSVSYLVDGEIAMFSRGGKPDGINTLFAAALKSVILAIEAVLGPGLILDGEIYAYRIATEFGPAPIELSKINGAVASCIKKGPTYQRNLSVIQQLEYHIFTFYHPAHPGMRAFERYMLLQKYLRIDTMGASHIVVDETGRCRSRDPLRIWLVPMRLIDCADTATKFYSEAIDLGYEGIMVYANAPYEQKRTDALLKLKGTEQEWFMVLGAELEANQVKPDEPTAKVVYCFNGASYTAGGFFKESEKRAIWKNRDKLAGKWALIRYQRVNQTSESGGALRDPKILYIANEQNGEEIDLLNM